MNTLLVILFILATLYFFFWLFMRGKEKARPTVKFRGKDVTLLFRFGSDLPRALKALATTLGKTVCFRYFPEGIKKGLLAHELGHVVRYLVKGAIVWWYEILRDIAIHPFNHDARKSEIQAEADGKLILAGTHPDLDAIELLESYQ